MTSIKNCYLPKEKVPKINKNNGHTIWNQNEQLPQVSYFRTQKSETYIMLTVPFCSLKQKYPWQFLNTISMLFVLNSYTKSEFITRNRGSTKFSGRCLPRSDQLYTVSHLATPVLLRGTTCLKICAPSQTQRSSDSSWRLTFLLELLMFSDLRYSVFNVLSDSCNAPMSRL